MTDPMPLLPDDADRVEALLDAAFGPDRRTRTAYRIRGDAAADPRTSFVVRERGMLVGAILCFPVQLALDNGALHPLTMIGPVAVLPSRQRDGLGRVLVGCALEAVAGFEPDGTQMLIGDPEYYGRFFDFSAERTALWRVPGPVERRRLLARGRDVPNAAGLLGPRPTNP